MNTVIALDETAILWSAAPEERSGRPLLVLMHGYYGDEQDWSEYFDALPPGCVGASLRAPIAVGERWAWVDFNNGQGVGHLSAAARGIRRWLDTLDAPRLYLVGWSQGGAMAVHLMRQEPERYVGAAMVGGFVWDRRPHKGLAAARPPVFAGWGTLDDVIGPTWVQGASRWLAAHTQLEERRYEGLGHELRQPMIEDVFAHAGEHVWSSMSRH